MGQTVTSHVCFTFCLFIPLFGGCRICLNDCNFHKNDPKCKGKGKSELADNILNTPMIQDFWGNLGQVKTPPDMCGHFNGTFTAPGTCAFDFSYVDSAGFLRLVEGVDTAGQLCSVLKGGFSDGQCVIDLKDTTAKGDGTLEVKKGACAKLKSTWNGATCEVPGYTG
ncbi:hypothetical protein P171DRAFT_469313 [Karstenula rhodostoma CBS 690.94]|uniref:Uncharacterized protein n=1 Tax=Karstenula rhodostoma CBS 690.94 TaxID=1392251 RepID=A0A9P4PTV3_9PLEO|nr:hypothetical protein P171DRAFT_469313 [Karstenula rhodostoma CBS 690.94]